MSDEQNQQPADDTPAPEQEAAAPVERSEVEQLAMEMGWNPDYKPTNGKQARSAYDWVKSTNLHNKRLQRDVESMRDTLDRSVAAMDKQAKRELKQQADEIERRFADAVEAKDTTAAAKAANEMRQLEADNQAPAPRNDDAVSAFKRDNPWFERDDEATAYAVAQSNRLAASGITDPAKQLAEVAKLVRKRFPEHFEQEQQREQPKTLTLNNPGRSTQQRKSEGFSDMPEAAKAAANRFYEAAKMRGTAPDRKKWETDYARDYFQA